jgi:hypothetical protein
MSRCTVKIVGFLNFAACQIAVLPENIAIISPASRFNVAYCLATRGSLDVDENE